MNHSKQVPFYHFRLITLICLIVLGIIQSPPVVAQKKSKGPTTAQWTGQRPIQADVDYHIPSKAEAEKCKVQSAKVIGQSGWIVIDLNGRMLRRFVDTNGDRKIDRWCYYKEGVEVYRDIDSDFDKKADEYRWLGTDGLRIGRDPDQDGEIDKWIAISPEEVSAEVVAALRDNDFNRFKRVLLQPEQLKSLGLGERQSESLAKKIEKSKAAFKAHAAKNKLPADAKWLHFGGTRPGLIPKGTDGSEKDVTAYDNVAALVRSKNGSQQVAIGTLFKVGNTWQVVDLPEVIKPGKVPTNGGFFMQSALAQAPSVNNDAIQGVTVETQRLIREFEQVGKKIAQSSDKKELVELNDQRADILEKLIKTDDKFRSNWVRQFADTISSAFQSRNYPKGLSRLEKFFESVADNDEIAKADKAYVEFRFVNARYSDELSKADQKGYDKVQKDWIKQLEAFADKYPKSDDTADALFQLAIAQELYSNEDKAETLYTKIVKNFGDSRFATKARGALRRINSVGKKFELTGKTIDAVDFDIAKLKGKVVLVHYWATWYEQSTSEFRKLEKLIEKYSDEGLRAVGISVDNDPKQLSEFIKAGSVPKWTQLYSKGGLDSDLANAYGIGSLPTIIIVDREGKVAKKNIGIDDIEDEIKPLLRD